MCTRSPEVLRVVLIAAKTSGDSGPGVSQEIFRPIQDSFTTQGFKPETAPGGREPGFHSGVKRRRPTALKPQPIRRVNVVCGRISMPYALFSNDAKLSKAYPTEADVWKHARLSGLVVDVATEEDKPAPRPVLDNDYEIKPCRPDPQEDPAKNQADAEREAELDFQLNS
jgi:hypothetical protein